MGTQPAPASVAPDWDGIAEQIHCPLCEYNLHGISEPRCPECGYSFEWAEILDPTRRLHSYLYEHHPEKSAWAFRQTATHALLPRRFWRQLHPAQPSCPRRLIRYWLMTSLMLGLLFGGFAAAGIVTGAQTQLARNQREHAWWVAFSQNPKTRPEDLKQTVQWMTSQYGSVDNYLNTAHPVHANWRVVWRATVDSVALLLAPLVLAGWPWALFAVLMIFQMSMRRAKVRPVHVLRCVIYSGGTTLWIGLLAWVLLVTDKVLQRNGIVVPGIEPHVAMWLFAAGGAISTWSLYIAYRKYLRFDHPAATVAAVQVVVVLSAVTARSVATYGW
jgi:hypothetical protein